MTIHLAPFQLQDFDQLISWIDSPEMLLQWSGPRRYTYPLDQGQLILQLAETLGPEPVTRIYKALNDHEQVVGHIEFRGINRRDNVAVLCAVMIAPAERGKQLCLPMVRCALQMGFEELQFRRIELNVYDTNISAVSCYERAGFIREGTQRQTVMVGGRFVDTIMMAILRDDWLRSSNRT